MHTILRCFYSFYCIFCRSDENWLFRFGQVSCLNSIFYLVGPDWKCEFFLYFFFSSCLTCSKATAACFPCENQWYRSVSCSWSLEKRISSFQWKHKPLKNIFITNQIFQKISNCPRANEISITACFSHISIL